MLNQTVRMHIGMAASRDPDLTAGCVNLNQRADLVQQNPMAQFAELLSVCSDDVLEKIVNILGGTNNAMKFDHITKAIYKATFDLSQTRELQNMHLKLSANTLAQLRVTGAFANDSGLVNWAGDGNSVQCVVSTVLKDKCKPTGAAEADAARGGAVPLPGRLEPRLRAGSPKSWLAPAAPSQQGDPSWFPPHSLPAPAPHRLPYWLPTGSPQAAILAPY